MLALQKLAHTYESTAVVDQPRESPSEKVLRLALDLPANREQLESEALRVEKLLDGMKEPLTEEGAEIMDQLAEIFETQVHGIYGLLDAEYEEEFQEACHLLVCTDQMLIDLEGKLESHSHNQPMFC